MIHLELKVTAMTRSHQRPVSLIANRVAFLGVAIMAMAGCKPEADQPQAVPGTDTAKVAALDTAHPVAQAPVVDNRFVVRAACGDNLTPDKIWVRIMTGKAVDQYVGCRMVIRGYQVRIWSGSDYVMLRRDSRTGIPQVLLDYGKSKSPRVEGALKWNVPIVFTGLENFPLQNGSTVTAAMFALEEGMTNVRYDYGGVLDVHNNRLDTLVGKSIDICDSAINPEIGEVIQRLTGSYSRNFFDCFQLVEPVVSQGGFVIGNGCKAHLCMSDAAIYTIDIKTKRLSAAYVSAGNMYFYGENSQSPKLMCEPIRQWAVNHGAEL